MEARSEQVQVIHRAVGAKALREVVLAVRGDDRSTWISGQVTNETRKLKVGDAAYTAIVHEKGKILSDAWVVHWEHEDWLLVPQAALEVLLAHFEAHIIMEDVELVALPHAVFALVGPQAETTAKDFGAQHFVSDRIGWGGATLVGEREVLQGQFVEKGIPLLQEDAWECARLEAGIPEFLREFDSQNYVQEANLTARAVSFQKGCYVGQEVVCRLEMRGHVRRQLVPVRFVAKPSLEVPLEQGLGELKSLQYSASLGAWVGLAMVKWDAAKPGLTVVSEGLVGSLVQRPLAPEAAL